MKPLVTVICVCYNHEQFVWEALESVKAQTYPHIELIIVDDGSPDNSASVIHQWVEENQTARFIDLKDNHGYCSAFNKAFFYAKGEFYIDLAADDILLPNRIAEGIAGFLAKGERFGVQFSDAEYIDQNSQILRKHSDKFPHNTIPQGDVYEALIHRYFICSPTMMVRKSILDHLGGYDERLHYEDFDLWISASRQNYFFYLPTVLVQKRLIAGSLGQRQYMRSSKQMESTYLVCIKILTLNRTNEEKKALNNRIWYELKWNIRFFHVELITKYLALLVKNNI
jgi:glycosyltransferase involved in cell wall biosynthesis